MSEQTEKLECPTIKTLDDYMEAVLEIKSALLWSDKCLFLERCIYQFDKNNPKLLQKFQFEHILIYGDVLTSSKHLLPFTDLITYKK